MFVVTEEGMNTVTLFISSWSEQLCKRVEILSIQGLYLSKSINSTQLQCALLDAPMMDKSVDMPSGVPFLRSGAPFNVFSPCPSNILSPPLVQTSK